MKNVKEDEQTGRVWLQQTTEKASSPSLSLRIASPPHDRRRRYVENNIGLIDRRFDREKVIVKSLIHKKITERAEKMWCDRH